RARRPGRAGDDRRRVPVVHVDTRARRKERVVGGAVRGASETLLGRRSEAARRRTSRGHGPWLPSGRPRGRGRARAGGQPPPASGVRGPHAGALGEEAGSLNRPETTVASLFLGYR